MLFENDGKSYIMVDLYLNNRFLGYKDSYNYYDIDVDEILLFKKSGNEYIIRYNDVSKMMIVPMQLKINNSYNKINLLKKKKLMFVYNDDKFFFRKCKEIWDKIIELIGINNHIYFLKTNDDDKLLIMSDVYKNTSFVIEGNYRHGHNKVIIVLHSIIDDCIKKSLVQHGYS